MAGRWKVGKDGQAEWEELAEGVTAPNQIAPPPGQENGPILNQQTPQTQSPWNANDPLPIPPPANPRFQTSTAPPVNDNGQAPPPLPPVNTSPAPTPVQPYAPPPPPVPGTKGTRQPYQVMEGVDVNKLNDDSVQSDKYIASRILASGGSLADAAAAIGATVLDGTRMRLRTGEVIDTRRDEEGSNALQWLVQGGGEGGSPLQGTMNGMLDPHNQGDGHDSGGDESGMGGGSVNEAIQRLLARGEAPVNADDANIAGPTNAYRAQVDTAQRRSRAMLAERATAEGLNSGGEGSGYFDSALQGQMEQGGKDTASFQANLMINEIQARRQDVVNALQFAQGEEKMALEKQLAMMDDEIRRLSLSQQNSQFYDTMGYNMNRDQNDMDLQMLRLLMGGQ